MDHARWQVGGGRVGQADTEDIEVGDRLGAEARAEHVADHAAKPGGRAAVGLDRRGMVVRFNLHADVVVAIEPHHARVVAEHAHAPVIGAELLAHLPGGCKHRLLEEIVVPHAAGRADMVDRTAERLVAAVLTPGLRDRLQLDLEGIAAEPLKVVADRVEFGGREGEAPFAAEPVERRVVEAREADRLLRERPRPAAGQRAVRQWADHDIVDRLTGQEFPGQTIGLRRAEGGQPVFSHAANGRRSQAQQAAGFEGGFGRRIGDACAGQHMEHGRQTGGGCGQHRVARLRHGKGFGDRVGEHRGGEPLDVGPRQIALDQPAGRGRGPRAARDAQFGSAGDDRPRGVIAGSVTEMDVNFPQHRGLPWHA